MMVWAVGTLEGPPLFENAFQTQSGKTGCGGRNEGESEGGLNV